MRRSSQFAALLGTAVLVLAAAQAAMADDVLYESATLGPTGITAEQLTTQVVPGTNVNQFVFVGARFELSQPVVTSRIGGHFAARGTGGDFFGAVVALDDADDLPDSIDLSTADILGSTLLEFPELSDDVFADLTLPLSPGWYGIVFGSGQFGATGVGGSVNNNTDVMQPRRIGWQLGLPWAPRGTVASGQRLVLLGNVVPEPCAFSLAGMVMIANLIRSPRK